MPGQTAPNWTHTPSDPSPSMEGRAIARPNTGRLAASLLSRSPSMEGRAIARPNAGSPHGQNSSPASLQWRAGQLPGQTRPRRCSAIPGSPPFNGGPGNCPAKPCGRPADRGAHPPFNGGPGNCPAKHHAHRPSSWSLARLQWRAGQLPGQTREKSQRERLVMSSFNGGPGNCPAKPVHISAQAVTALALQWRAGQLPGQTRLLEVVLHIEAEVLQWRAGQLPGQTAWLCLLLYVRVFLQWRAGQLPGQTRRSGRCGACASAAFNGGPGNCPAKRDGQRREPHAVDVPSMEGRAIARPNAGLAAAAGRDGAPPSMEGRAIARPNRSRTCRAGCWQPGLQWRAGQLPGQTTGVRGPGAHHGTPSMEGRAIARPNRVRPSRGRMSERAFNGGPGNCPAKPWRPATSGRCGRCSFNGGPGNCPAKPLMLPQQPRCQVFLQWRAGQLPGQTSRIGFTRRRSPFPLQWRAGQLPGQTVHHRIHRGGQEAPSMEGRAIARPNHREVAASGELAAPSMEGRAIARPNRRLRPVAASACRLQWRAGQLPGQTTVTGAVLTERPAFLQWRAGQLPGQTERLVFAFDDLDDLQWRAGQLPGQTVASDVLSDFVVQPSMEGRAIARPNLAMDEMAVQADSRLQWRAGQLPGQTTRPRTR